MLLADQIGYRPYIRVAGFTQVNVTTQCQKPGQLTYLLNLPVTGFLDVCWPGGKPVRYRAGEALFLPPGTEMQMLGGYGRRLYLHFTVDLNPGWSSRAAQRHFGLRFEEQKALLQPKPEAVWGFSFPQRWPVNCFQLIKRELPEVIEDWLGATYLRRRSHHRLALLLDRLIERYTNDTGSSQFDLQKRIEHAEKVARQAVGAEFGVNEMARIAAYERSHFCKCYRKLRGEPPQVFLQRLRLAEAQRLLLESDLSIREIASALGYADSAAFRRMFKAGTGITPQQWHQNALNE